MVAEQSKATQTGALPADGGLLPINHYTAVSSILGTNFGRNGTTNFALPGRHVPGRASYPEFRP
jgi:microcystin-dependent protein